MTEGEQTNSLWDHNVLQKCFSSHYSTPQLRNRRRDRGHISQLFGYWIDDTNFGCWPWNCVGCFPNFRICSFFATTSTFEADFHSIKISFRGQEHTRNMSLLLLPMKLHSSKYSIDIHTSHECKLKLVQIDWFTEMLNDSIGANIWLVIYKGNLHFKTQN